MKCCIVGKFESFHKGHQSLIKEAKEKCNEVFIISIKKWKDGIFSDKEREVLAEKFKVKLITFNFEEIKDLTPEEFFLKLKEAGCQKLFAGEDWKFGKGRAGNISTAQELGKKLGIEVKVLPIKKFNGKKIGTSEIRKLLQEGKISEANKLLGFNYFCLGKVKEGNKLGRKIGFPTLNIEPEKELLMPNGVYEVRVIVDSKNFKGIANLGKRPTVSSAGKKVLEVHVPDILLPELYGKELKIEFLKFLRPEKKFSSIEELKTQIKLDVENLKRLWRS
ncbi:riboflavin biosynthesis protein RibF [Desulfurobacterium thermolithotrophum]|uniref:riboflavin biosynthesis protein RibF n=1 Tax=Desulfurobacterium thermolithotrophum TaxID=64160 RepID=UPI0013D852DC|nr:riboflavin biosynthesis protein RibF [Desulfurobacterium thermolithotrophum]